MSEIDSELSLDIQEAVIEEEKELNAPTTADPQLERTIISVCLRSQSAYGISKACLSEKDFSSPGPRAMWDAMLSLEQRGIDFNPVTLLSEVSARNKLKAVGGEAGVRSYYEPLGQDEEIASYCEQLRNFSIARMQAKAAKELAVLSRKPMAAIDRLDKTQKILSSIVESGAGRSTMETGMPMVERIGIDKLLDPTLGTSYITTEWTTFNRKFLGFEPGTLNAVGGRPGSGKTAWACSVMLHAAVTCRKRVAFFSLEMASRRILGRMACRLARVDFGRYRSGEMSEAESSRVMVSINDITDSPLWINDRRGKTPREVEQELYLMIAKGEKPDLCVIDHLHKMRPSEKVRDLREAYTVIIEDLTQIFKFLNIPLVLLCQLTKASKRADDRPHMADIREAGQIEDNADMVAMLHRPHQRKKDATPEERRLIQMWIDKERDGGGGKIEFNYVGQHFLFEAIDRFDEE